MAHRSTEADLAGPTRGVQAGARVVLEESADLFGLGLRSARGQLRNQKPPVPGEAAALGEASASEAVDALEAILPELMV